MLNLGSINFAALTVVAIAGGCQTNPITGRSQLMIVSQRDAEASSAQAYVATVSEARGKGKLDTDPPRVARVKAITDRLIAQAIRLRPESQKWEWSMHVIDEPEVNAWCMPGGKMAIYTGLLQKLQPSDDEIAEVLGHEIAHALLSHGQEKMSRALATQAGILAASVATNRDMTGLAPVAQAALLLPNSRQAETEADRLGIEIAARAAYNPEAAIVLWQKMGQLGGAQPPQFLSTHPSNQTRIDALSRLLPQTMPLYQAAKAGRR